MRRPRFTPTVESVERRLSLTALGAVSPSIAADVEPSRAPLQNEPATTLSTPTPRAPGTNGIIAILIG